MGGESLFGKMQYSGDAVNSRWKYKAGRASLECRDVSSG
jgi:hypothetical protein